MLAKVQETLPLEIQNIKRQWIESSLCRIIVFFNVIISMDFLYFPYYFQVFLWSIICLIFATPFLKSASINHDRIMQKYSENEGENANKAR